MGLALLWLLEMLWICALGWTLKCFSKTATDGLGPRPDFDQVLANFLLAERGDL